MVTGSGEDVYFNVREGLPQLISKRSYISILKNKPSVYIFVKKFAGRVTPSIRRGYLALVEYRTILRLPLYLPNFFYNGNFQTS